MSTTLLIPVHDAPPRRIPLAFRSRGDADTCALIALDASVPVLVALQVVAVALAWPADVPQPWLAGPEEEVKGLRKRVEGAEAWLAESSRKGNQEDVAQARRDLRECRHGLAEGEARLVAAQNIAPSRDLAELRASADRVLAGLPTVPTVVVYFAGRDLLNEVSTDLLRGFAEYQRMKAEGFSAAPDGEPSAGASSSPATTGATPSSG